MNKISLLLALFLTAVLAASSAGCSIRSPDELYSLPQTSDEYVRLQEMLDEEIASGSEYSAPVSGGYRQSVQLYDIDGDGANEALAFFRDSEQTPRICVYRYAGDYALAATITGEGSAIGSVEYVDMDGDAITELVVTWQDSSGLKILNVYSLKNYSASVLLTTDCAAFQTGDMDTDGLSELMCIRFDGTETGSVELYKLSPDGEMLSASDKLSGNITALSRARSSALSDGVPALYVESACGDSGVVTDIFIYVDGEFRNITLNRATGVSGTQRAYAVYSTDIDGDKSLNVPEATPLPKYSENSSTYWVFDWYAYDSLGEKTLVLSTYHCYSDGWYLALDEALRANLTVRREDTVAGERVVVLSVIDPGTGDVADILTIYTLTGDNRWDRARLGARFVLRKEDTAIYAARIDSPALSMTESGIAADFNLIYAEWNTGAL